MANAARAHGASKPQTDHERRRRDALQANNACRLTVDTNDEADLSRRPLESAAPAAMKRDERL